MAASFPLCAQDTVIAEICNKGDTALHVARVIYSQSLFSGNSYQVTGWYGIEPADCKVVYNSDSGDPAYLGFTFLDSHDVVRTFTAHPTRNSGPFKAMAENFCVAPSPFSYVAKTKEELQQCRLGFEPLDFSLYVDPASAEGARSTFEMSPHQAAVGNVFGSHSSAKARLIFGDEVTLYGNQWSYANGAALPESLIISKTGLPPLLPKQQYSTSQAPVAGYVQEIKDVMSSFQSCSTEGFLKRMISSSQLDMDDYGIVNSMETDTFAMTDGPHSMNLAHGAAIANLDLTSPRITDDGPRCVRVIFDCKDGVPCVRSGNDTAFNWPLTVNTREQANTILNSLRAIAPYYPEGRGEIN